MRLLTPEYPLLFWTLFTVAGIGLWVFALVDVLRNDFRCRNGKLIWTTVALLPFLGTVLYLVIGSKQRIKINRY